MADSPPANEPPESGARSTNDVRTRCEKNSDGDWILERPTLRGGAGGATHEVNITTLLERAGRRTTGNPFILQVEHDRIERGESVGNPAEPTSRSVIPHAVKTRIDQLDSAAEIRQFIEAEIESGPRQYVIGMANERKSELASQQ